MSKSWLDPENDDPQALGVQEAGPLDESQLRTMGHGLLGEALVAQRVLAARRLGLQLGKSLQDTQDLAHWGHFFPSAVAVLMPPAATQDADQRRRRRVHQEQLLRAQEAWPDIASVRNAAYLLCSDGQPPEKGLPSQLYLERESVPKLTDFDGFEPLLQLLTKTVSPSLGPAWLTGKPWLKEAITTIILETFKNTHDHARRELNKSNIKHSVRALYARYYSISEVLELAKVGDPNFHSPALRYARNFIPREVPAGVRVAAGPDVGGVLELSVLDSGPGMAAKLLGRDVLGVPVTDQLDAVKACFEKGRTTTGTKGRGYGLAKVLQRLQLLHGFMSVRTNSVHVFRQFGSLHTGVAVEDADDAPMPDATMFDWRRPAARMPSARSHVNGTLVSFLVPMAAGNTE